ncbi:ABC transporter permease [Myceligenerans indicum]|uniref:ABC transporter permease n=1 Tax=Myceligenerans indicum TaxID=2593663 RepID=A0ABS1LNZ2_9MICO|nr:ABC transporter permease [Myceligenerans indicum]MBL0887937.1 ABC transporter permease [Myceligenerans indicum]
MTTTTSEARRVAVRAGLVRGLLEARQSLREPGDVLWYFLMPLVFAVVLIFMRGTTVPGTDFALGAMVLPSILGMSIAFGGLTGPAGMIATEREDGTLLRAKATPNGMIGYLVGKTILFGTTTLISTALLVIPGFTVAGDLRLDARTWAMLAGIFVMGLVTTVPVGVALGSLFKNASQTGLLLLGSMVLMVPSGIFYPITALPAWLQWIGQVFPYYWLGLGARSAMLPAEMAAAEIGGSWRTLEMFGVLGAWAVVGFIVAPVVLRRMARRASGAAVAEARDRVMAQGW